MKKISIGEEFFSDFIQKNCYYVDKTPYIKTVFYDDLSKVLLITRPRRFGKTFTMNTFYEFLRLNPRDPNNIEDTSYQHNLFKDTKIYEDKEFCRKYMGKFPVIFVSFKNVFGKDFKCAYEQLGSTIFELVSQYHYLIENNDDQKQRLTDRQKEQFNLIYDKQYLCDVKNQNTVKDSLSILTEILNTYHGVKPILLIDEYDVPIAKAASNGYYDEMINIISILLGKVLKTNPNLGKAILTGCLRAAKESIFTGLNNLRVCSITDDDNIALSEGIGFTKEETEQVLKYYNLEQYSNLVADNYDGYSFGDVHMYCPWDVMNFCNSNYQKVGKENAKIIADNYWINSSGNDVIEEYMGYIKPQDINQMQDLLDGKSITSVIRTSLCYGDLKSHNIEDFWTLLLYTGYLTFDPKSLIFDDSTNGEYVCDLYIPNKEVRRCFRSKILNFYKQNVNIQNCITDLINGLFRGEQKTVEEILNKLLSKYVSIRDFSSKAPKENYYHGFMNVLLINGSSIIQEQNSNMESGNGYVDIIISSATESEIAILELKQTTQLADDRNKMAISAVGQIKSMQYANPYMSNTSIKSIYAYGICFYRKQSTVVVEKLK